eukprot:771688-Rhodomonas_salina.2
MYSSGTSAGVGDVHSHRIQVLKGCPPKRVSNATGSCAESPYGHVSHSSWDVNLASSCGLPRSLFAASLGPSATRLRNSSSISMTPLLPPPDTPTDTLKRTLQRNPAVHSRSTPCGKQSVLTRTISRRSW